MGDLVETSEIKFLKEVPAGCFEDKTGLRTYLEAYCIVVKPGDFESASRRLNPALLLLSCMSLV